MRVYFNREFNLVEINTASFLKHGVNRLQIKDQNTLWEAQNGFNKPYLSLKSFLSCPCIETNAISVNCELSFYKKGNSAIIQITDPLEITDNRTVGIFFNHEYGYTLLPGQGGEIFAAESTGGPGNTASKFGIYIVGSVIKVHSYMERNGSLYYELRQDGGWQCLGKDILTGDEVPVRV